MQEVYERLVRLETETKAQTRILTEICRDNKAIQRHQAAHEKDDERRLSSLETQMRLTHWIGVPIVGAIIGYVKSKI